MANKPEIKKKTHGGKEEEKREKQNNNTFWTADNNTAGQQTLTNYPTQRKNERFVKHWDYPPHSYIVNERYNSRNKRASQEKKTVNGKNRQLAQPQPQTLTQGGHEIASLLN